MGLDMCLYRKHYIRNHEMYKPENRDAVTVITGGEVNKKIKPERITYVVEEVGYWRKANHIHKWFVDKVQGGVDNCGSYYVDRETLENLLEDCKQVKSNHALAEVYLPTQSGFFFGGTDYDEYYYRDIEDTIKILEGILEDKDADEFEYSSSW